MADIKDILGVPRGSAGADVAPAKEQKKEVKMKRPEGMSREAFALLGDSHPIMSSQFATKLTKKAITTKQPKPSSKGIPTYQLRPFKNTARTDGLELTHWVKCHKTATGLIKEPEEEYSFAKYNKKVRYAWLTGCCAGCRSAVCRPCPHLQGPVCMHTSCMPPLSTVGRAACFLPPT